ncbi:hypothetical protein PI87_08855 [Ralstonia sp. A12]|uniref:contractile injection system tape measure protein n=1 Tax=Ralstonia sp. A12 TaxID=1217052 RepID=UPI000574BFFA|nr:contractile injection system tape measure protein [Ralstonia sp. A12]KHK57319.1 hypothetical protein PI87_08855 [Ralstonia sp. A12]
MTTDNLIRPDMNDNAVPIPVSNAGAVLLCPFLPLYFERCSLAVRDGQFVDAAASHRAVRLVHLLASGQWVEDETVLPLAKVMCGVALSTALQPTNDAPTEQELELNHSLLHAVTQHWDRLRHASIDALRATFLMRDGRLTQSGAGTAWQLNVQRTRADVFLSSLPWSFNIVKFAWMPQPVHVQW